MTYKLLLEEARKIIDESLTRSGLSAPQYNISRPPSSQFGDLSSNVAFIVSKRTGLRPGEVVLRLASFADPTSSTYISEVVPHQSGYLNFRVNMKNFATTTLDKIISDQRFGLPSPESRQRISVEHTSVNPAHPLHIGHLRNVVIGDSLARLLGSAGHQVHVLNYIDDTGLQVAMAMLGVLELGLKVDPPAGVKADHHIGGVYVEANRRVEQDPALDSKRRRISEQLEKGEGAAYEIAAKMVETVVRAQLQTCWRVGAEYDLLNFESQILRTGLWETVFQKLKELGVAKLARGGKFDGCWVMEGGDENEEEKVLVRSDGTAVYAAKDIPYAAWKLGMLHDPFKYRIFAQQSTKTLWSTSDKEGGEPPLKFNDVDRTISVIGAEQSRPQKFVKSALIALGPRGEGYHHLAYGKVSLSAKTAKQIQSTIPEEGPVSMKGRTGMYVSADDALDALKRKAAQETRKRNPEAEPAWIQGIAESIAVAAIRYELVKQDLNKPIVFDMDEALRLEGDTGPYLMYSYARARSVIRKAGIQVPVSATVHSAPFELDIAEKELIVELSRTEVELDEALKYMSPRLVANHAFSISMSFNVFYEKCPILTAHDGNIRDWRLLLTHCTSIVLSRLMDIIGIPHPESI
jgi:arginyl-tRNA synthetase